MTRSSRRASVLAAVLLGTACGWEGEVVDGLAVRTRTARPGVGGRLRVEAPVDDDVVSLQLVAVTPGANDRGYVAAVELADGTQPYFAEDLWDASRNRTNAAFASAVPTMSWPIDGSDPPLGVDPVVFRLVFDQVPSVDLTLVGKVDDDLTAGVLRIDLVFAGNLEDDDNLRSGTEAAIAHWQDTLYAAGGPGRVGIELVVQERTWDGVADLTSPGYGDYDVYREALADKPLRAVTLLVVNRVLEGVGVYGVSGGIPGSLVASDRSVVVASALEAAGSDRKFSDAEVVLFGETMAHEVGHYLGLFHPAELGDATGAVSTWDALGDTPECGTDRSCADALGGNLMFPTPLCANVSVGGGCAEYQRQQVLTADQRDVIHRHVAVE